MLFGLTAFLLTVCINISTAQPFFEWAKSMGGVGNRIIGSSIALDKEGNTYTTGFFYGTVDFDPGLGIYNLTAEKDENVFISKLDANGNLIWAKSLGGGPKMNYIYCYSIALDANENVYTTGYYDGIGDFDPGVGIYNLTSVRFGDVFISKLDANGNFVWAKSIGGKYSDYSRSIAIDALGDVYCAGGFQDTADFDPGPKTYNLIAIRHEALFITKLDANGNLVWAKAMQGTDYETNFSIVIDMKGAIYTTGYFYGTVDFDPGPNTYNLTSAGNSDVFVCKLDAKGDFVWAQSMGGSEPEYGIHLALDSKGNIYTTGFYIGTADFDPGGGVFNLTAKWDLDVFVSKLDSNGNFVWAKSLGGKGMDSGHCIAIDAKDNVYITGIFGDTADFDSGPNTYNLIAKGNNDAFITKLAANGDFIWAQSIGGIGSDAGNAIALDVKENIYSTGTFADTVDFDPSIRIYNLTAIGKYDTYVSKLSQSSSSITPLHPQTLTYRIFPNPATGLITIEASQTAQLQVYNVTGALVYQSQLLQTHSQHDLSALANGVYFLKLLNEKGAVTEKLVIAR
jgi:hypothetical protein